MIFTDDFVDLMINALIEEYNNSAVSEDSMICFSDYISTLKRMYPNLIKYFEDYFLKGLTVKEIASKNKYTIDTVVGNLNKIRGFTVVYFYKRGAIKCQNCKLK